MSLPLAFPSSVKIGTHDRQDHKSVNLDSEEPQKSNPTSTFHRKGKEFKEFKWPSQDHTNKR